MPEALRQVVVHSFIAVLVAEALVRLWEVPPSQRLICRLGSLALPVVLLPVFEVFAPFRRAAWFAEGPALFSSRHLEVLPFDPLWPLGAFGLLLLLRDLRAPGARWGEAPWADGPRRLAPLAAKAQVPVPPIDLIEADLPLLLVVGARAPRLKISTGLIALLDEGELDAALAHELSHVRHRDIAWSWALLGLRILQPLSPAAQIAARVAARELEWRADADSVRWTQRPLALASALLKVHDAPVVPGPGELTFSQRARELEVETRCRRLLEPSGETPVPPALFAGAALGLTLLLFFVT